MGEITLQQALEEYQTIYMPSRNYAPRTRQEYLNDLTDLVQFLEEKAGVKRVGEVSLIHLERYLAELDQRNYAGLTRRRKAITIRTFFNFLHHEGYVTNDVAQRLIPPFTEYIMPRVLSQAEYQRLLQACTVSVRDTAILELLLQTGIRLSELVNIKLSDIDLPDRNKEKPKSMGVLRITNHNGQEVRSLPLNSKVCQALMDYLQVRPPVQNTVLFLNRFYKPLGPRGVQKLMGKYLDQAGIKGASVHSLRHTFGVHHVAKGTSIKTIQEVMGHQDIRTTEVYIPLAQEMKRRELEENAL